MKKLKNIAIILLTGALLFAFTIWGIFLEDQELSKSERRKLEQLPKMTIETILDRSYMKDLESYLLDQFPLRDSWRTIKAMLIFDIFGQKDNNGVYLVDDNVLKIEYPLKEDQIKYGASKINQVIEQYLQESNVYYSIIPDKNYFMAESNGYPHLDYNRLEEIMMTVKGTYIDIMSGLNIENYYRTDAHWKQEYLLPLVEKLTNEMGVEKDITPIDGYEKNKLKPFYGVYCGQSALSVEPDEIIYLTNESIENAILTGAEFQGELPIYTVDRFDGMDGYDIFLNGAQAVLNIVNPSAKEQKELIIFRDSFGSSIAPLLIEAYSKITLIDLRYISSSILSEYVEFHGQDVLFLYSTSMLNSSRLMK